MKILSKLEDENFLIDESLIQAMLVCLLPLFMQRNIKKITSNTEYKKHCLTGFNPTSSILYPRLLGGGAIQFILLLSALSKRFLFQHKYCP